MPKIWKKHSQKEIQQIIFDALGKNINYENDGALGVPASYLDEKIFNQDAAFLKDAPFMTALIKNPNHIGCHTMGHSESFFQGTHVIERELIEICAVDILKGKENEQDGYVASGGTEANIQAMWIYRNYFAQEHGASYDEIAILCSADSHYSMNKGANLLNISIYKYGVDSDHRTLDQAELKATIQKAKADGKKYFIVISNMMTTMFGSVDDLNAITDCLVAEACNFKLHIDGAYGGFYYPFTTEDNVITFENPHITSFTLDAHKMAQSPYGTGIFLIRKGYMQYANTQEASYVAGEDFTLIGSRSGANAIAVWMILVKNGPFGWHEKVFILQKRTQWLCDRLAEMNIEYFRDPRSNIVTIKKEFVTEEIAVRFGLVPDNHHHPKWLKVVVMDHVTVDKLGLLVEALQKHHAGIVS